MKQPPVTGPRAATLLGFPIGCLLGLAQSPLCQERQGLPDAGALVAIAPQDREFRQRFRALLMHDRDANLPSGWRLAADLGHAAGPLLWDMWEREDSNIRSRTVLLAAAAIAEGIAADDRVVQVVSASRADEERIMGMLILALGPDRPAARPGLWPELVGRRPVPALEVAAWLACARFPGLPGGNALPDGDDPGRLAAALYSGVTVPAEMLRPWLERDSSLEHRQLVMRGYLLGCLRRVLAGGPMDTGCLNLAKWLYGQENESLQLGRRAAALLLAHVEEPSALLDSLPGSRPRWEVLQALASTQAMRECLPAEWLGPVPAALDEEPQRIAVEYGLARPLDEVLQSASRWAHDLAVRDHLAITVAWRLLDAHRFETRDPPDEVPDFPAWSWVRWAAGAGNPQDVGDAPLDRAAVLAARGGLPPEAARRLLEEALWRWGSHPGLGIWQAEHLLVRDLLLTGSAAGVRYSPGVPVHERYLPKGIQPGDRVLFPTALEYYEFVTTPRAPIPAGFRLR